MFVDGEVIANRRAALPAGLFQVGEENVGFRHRAPDLGEHTDEVLASRDTAAAGGGGRRRRSSPGRR